MLTYLRWSFWIVFWTIIAAFFHYTLPQHDIVRITQTERGLVNVGENSWFWSQPDAGNSDGPAGRDVRFIRAASADGVATEYRNEDTGLWGWPPYFKINSDTVQSRAAKLQSTASEPVWVAIKHYGWRSQLISIYPNVLSVREVEGPDVWIIPWTSIIVLTIFGCTVWAIWSRIRRFRRQRIDPLLDDVEEGITRAHNSWFGGSR